MIDSLDTMEVDAVMTSLEAQGAKATVDSLNWPQQFPYHPLTTLSLAHSAEKLYIDVFVRCNYLRAVNYTNNSDVHEDSSIVFFIRSERLGGVWRLGFNAIATVSATFVADDGTVTRMTDSQINTISRYASCGYRPFEELEGLFSWNLLLSIPLELLGLRPGEAARANVYKTAYGTSQPHLLSWIPVNTPEPSSPTAESSGLFVLE